MVGQVLILSLLKFLDTQSSVDPPDSGVQPRVSPTVEFHTVPADCSGQPSKRQCLGVCPVAHGMSPVNVRSSLWTPEETVWKNERKQSPRPRGRDARGTQPVQEHTSKTARRSGLWSLLLPENLLLSCQIIILHWALGGDGVRRNETPRQGLCAVFSFHLLRFALWPSRAVLGVAGRSLPSVLGGCGMWLR